MKTRMWLALVRGVSRPVYRSAFRRTVRGRLVDPDEPRAKRFLNDDVDAVFTDAWREVEPRGDVTAAAGSRRV